MKMKKILIALLLIACKSKSPAPAPKPAPPKPVAAASVDAGPPVAPPARGAWGPTIDQCTKLADHLNGFVMQEAQVGMTDEQVAYTQKLVSHNRPQVIEYCLQIASPAEVECVLAAPDMGTLLDCERRRREVGDLPMHPELTQADCEHFFDRHRQFALTERGISPAEEDANKDLIVRECLDKGQRGAVSCFIAAPTWDIAQRCPVVP
jgi:hypothetical protein